MIQNVEFSATCLNSFCASKSTVFTTFNTDICSLGLVQKADNSHHLCRDPTFEENLFVWIKNAGRDVIERTGTEIITLPVLETSKQFLFLRKKERIMQ